MFLSSVWFEENEKSECLMQEGAIWMDGGYLIASCLAELWFRSTPAGRQVHGDIYQLDKSPFKLDVYFFIATIEIQLSARSSDGDNKE